MKTAKLIFAALLTSALLLAGCTSAPIPAQPPTEAQTPETTPAVTPAFPKQDAEEAQTLIVGTWTEVNRDGNVETVTWGADGSFQAITTTPDGDLVELDNGWYEFVDGQLVLSVANAGGDWNGGALEPIDPPLENWYNYYVAKNVLHLERTKRVMFGNTDTFNPPLIDDYTRK